MSTAATTIAVLFPNVISFHNCPLIFYLDAIQSLICSTLRSATPQLEFEPFAAISSITVLFVIRFYLKYQLLLQGFLTPIKLACQTSAAMCNIEHQRATDPTL
jgi:hypothetical protein